MNNHDFISLFSSLCFQLQFKPCNLEQLKAAIYYNTNFEATFSSKLYKVMDQDQRGTPFIFTILGI